MKITSLLSTTALAAALVFAGCTKQEQQKVGASVKDAYEDTKAAAARTWDKAKAATWDKRGEVTESAKALGARMDAQLSELRANYSEAKASASRKTAMDEVKRDEADYKQKLDALGTATADTWDAAKRNVIAAWDKLEASYRKARAD